MPRILGIDVGLRNLAVCAVDVEEETFTVRQWAVLDVLKEKKAKQVTIEESVSLMLNALGERPALFEGVELVAIESQPVGRVVSANVRMKVVSHCIQSFVALKTDCKCCFVNPKSKLTQELVRKMCGEQDEEGGDANSKKRYTQHKKMAVEAVGKTLAAEWTEFWDSLGAKKDDAADALLLALVAGRPKRKRRGRRSGNEKRRRLPRAMKRWKKSFEEYIHWNIYFFVIF